MENQYFLGSSYSWHDYNSLKADNVVPMAIVSKIIDKIKAGERFAAYVVIPLHPEGDPATPTTQEILFWQWSTLAMMYGRIGTVLWL